MATFLLSSASCLLRGKKATAVLILFLELCIMSSLTVTEQVANGRSSSIDFTAKDKFLSPFLATVSAREPLGKEALIQALNQTGQFEWATSVLAIMNLKLLLPESSTVFIPIDRGMKEAGLSVNSYSTLLPILQYHVIPRRLTFLDLQQLPEGTRLPTLLANSTVIITSNSSANYTVDDVPLVKRDVFLDSSTVFHGIGGVMHFAEYGTVTDPHHHRSSPSGMIPPSPGFSNGTQPSSSPASAQSNSSSSPALPTSPTTNSSSQPPTSPALPTSPRGIVSTPTPDSTTNSSSQPPASPQPLLPPASPQLMSPPDLSKPSTLNNLSSDQPPASSLSLSPSPLSAPVLKPLPDLAADRSSAPMRVSCRINVMLYVLAASCFLLSIVILTSPASRTNESLPQSCRQASSEMIVALRGPSQVARRQL